MLPRIADSPRNGESAARESSLDGGAVDNLRCGDTRSSDRALRRYGDYSAPYIGNAFCDSTAC